MEEENGAPRVVDKRGSNHKPAGQVPVSPPQFGQLSEEQLAELLEQARNDDSTPPEQQDRQPVLTAFAVVIFHDGTVQALGDVSVFERIEMSRPVTYPDMYSAAGHIQKDIQSQETAIHVAATLKNEAARAQDQLLAAKVRQQQMQAQRR